MKSNVKRGLAKNKFFVFIGRKIFGKAVLKYCKAEVQSYTPKHDTFIVIGNHTDFMDPGYEILSLNRYLRFVCADHILRDHKILKFLFKDLGGVIVKYKDKPSSVLTDEILENLKNGISVAIHAEGGTCTNGVTGFVSENTGKLVKDSGVALITYRTTGAYLRKPRWANEKRDGKVYGRVVHEYSPEFLSELTPKEITSLIKEDIYVNAFSEQRAMPQQFKGERLAECLERILFVCPECKNIGTLHSKDDVLMCDCGYKVRYGEDVFFHDLGHGVAYDNIYEWDMWQRDVWYEKIDKADDEIFREGKQTVYKVNGYEKELLMYNANIVLNKKSIELITRNMKIRIPLNSIKKMQLASRDALAIIIDDNYYYIQTGYPRSAEKYISAWRKLTNREYY